MWEDGTARGGETRSVHNGPGNFVFPARHRRWLFVSGTPEKGNRVDSLSRSEVWVIFVRGLN